MKTRFFIFIFLILSVSGFAQEVDVVLYPDKEFSTNMHEFPVTLNWDTLENRIDIQFKGNPDKSQDEYIYFFKEIRLIKEIKEQDNDLLFSKEIKKKLKNKLVDKCYGDLENCQYKHNPNKWSSAEIHGASLKALELAELRFVIKNPAEEQCKITIRAYRAKSGASKRKREIKSELLFSFNITLRHSLCDAPELKTVIEGINEKTKDLKNLGIEMKAAINNCTLFNMLKDKSKQYKAEQVESIYAADCETWKKAMEENKNAYNTLPRDCKKTVDTPPVCQPILNTLKSANDELVVLLLQIRKEGNSVNVQEKYASIKKDVNLVYNPKCPYAKEEKEVYDAYTKLCKGIDELSR